MSFEGTIEEWRDALQELAQATFKEDNSGRKQVDKMPGVRMTTNAAGNPEPVRSPNIADAICYSFVNGFNNGLRAHAEVETVVQPVKIHARKFSAKAY